MKNSLFLLLILFFYTACSTPFSKPTINVYYIQEANSTVKPNVAVKGDQIRISTVEKKAKHPHTKIRMYFVFKSFCPACENMKKHMQSPEIATLLKREFTVTMVNIREKETLPKIWMRPTVAPSIFFLDSNNEELISGIHSMSEARFFQTLQEAVKARDL